MSRGNKHVLHRFTNPQLSLISTQLISSHLISSHLISSHPLLSCSYLIYIPIVFFIPALLLFLHLYHFLFCNIIFIFNSIFLFCSVHSSIEFWKLFAHVSYFQRTLDIFFQTKKKKEEEEKSIAFVCLIDGTFQHLKRNLY